MSNTGLFIDIAKQYNSITRANRDVKIDYKKFLEEISKDNNIHRAFAYGIQINNESESFIKVLRHIGFITRYKYAKMVRDYNLVNNELVVTEKPNIQESNWTLGITIDIVKNIDHLNKIILGSNDIELLELVEWIKNKGVVVEICSRNIPKELRNLADKTYDIPSRALLISNNQQLEPANVETNQSQSLELPANKLLNGS